MHHNLPFKHIEINHISYDITITYEGHFVKVSIEEFLTILSPNMDDQCLKNESKTLTPMDILEQWAVIKFCV